MAQTMRARGMAFAGKGDRRTPEQTAQVERSAPSDAKPASVIDRRSFAEAAGVSEATARRAIADAQKLEEEAKRTEAERA